jgi:hypothetical protein
LAPLKIDGTATQSLGFSFLPSFLPVQSRVAMCASFVSAPSYEKELSLGESAIKKQKENKK